MESPLGKQQAGANATQSFGRNFEVSSLFPNNGPKVFQSEFTMIAQVEEDSLKPVYPAFQDLNNAVNGLDAKISGIVQRQNEDYLQEYRNEMVGIQKELMEMRKKYEDFIARNNGEEQIEELKKQLNLKNIDVLKLDQVITNKNKEIKALKKSITFLQEERNFLNEYIATSVRKNKLISIERHTKPPVIPPGRNPMFRNTSEVRARRLERTKTPDLSFQDEQNGIFKLSNIVMDEYNQDLSRVQFETGIEKLDEFLNEIKLRDFGDKFRILKDFENFSKEQAIAMEKKLQDSKKKILREKTKIDGFLNSRLIARSELAEIFEDCVDRCKKNIERRRLEGLRLGREGSELAEKKAVEAMRGVKIDYRDFMSHDKNQLLELFIFDETVLNVIKYLISGGKGLNKRPATLNTDKDSKRHNQSVDQEQPESILGVSELNDLSMDAKNSRSRRQHSSQPLRHSLLQPMALSLAQKSETKKEMPEADQAFLERKATQSKMEQILGGGPIAPQAGLSQIRLREITRNYKI